MRRCNGSQVANQVTNARDEAERAEKRSADGQVDAKFAVRIVQAAAHLALFPQVPVDTAAFRIDNTGVGLASWEGFIVCGGFVFFVWQR